MVGVTIGMAHKTTERSKFLRTGKFGSRFIPKLARVSIFLHIRGVRNPLFTGLGDRVRIVLGESIREKVSLDWENSPLGSYEGSSRDDLTNIVGYLVNTRLEKTSQTVWNGDHRSVTAQKFQTRLQVKAGLYIFQTDHRIR